MIATHKSVPIAVPIRIPIVGPERIISLFSSVFHLVVNMSGRSCLINSLAVIVLMVIPHINSNNERFFYFQRITEARIVPQRKLTATDADLTLVYRSNGSRDVFFSDS
jgi:hypothetical protein